MIKNTGNPSPVLWMLDTNILSHVIRNPHGPLAEHLKQLTAHAPQQLCTSVIVHCELSFGAERVQSASLQEKIDVLMQYVVPRPLGLEAVTAYAQTRAMLERQGTPIGPNDTLIAAHALALGCTLVTDNEAEFRRVPGLRVENWLQNVPT